MKPMFQIVVMVEVRGIVPYEMGAGTVWCVVGCYDWDGKDRESLHEIINEIPLVKQGVDVNWKWELHLKADSSLMVAAINLIETMNKSKEGSK